MTNKEYKDGMLRVLFNDPQKALKLYSDITGKKFNKNTTVEIKTLENVFLSKLRDDITFIINNALIVIFEHQSTLNKNMPLRALQYVLLFFALFYKLSDALYREKIIKLPKPEFYMLYNGKTAYPPKGVMRLSDAFMSLNKKEKPNLELVVNVININYDVNSDILNKNTEMRGYATFVNKIRRNQDKGMKLPESIRLAMRECISEGILIDFFEKYKEEVYTMFSLVYDEEIAKQVAREEGREEGEIKKLLRLINKKLQKNKTREQIIEELELDNDEIEILDNYDKYFYLLNDNSLTSAI